MESSRTYTGIPESKTLQVKERKGNLSLDYSSKIFLFIETEQWGLQRKEAAHLENSQINLARQMNTEKVLHGPPYSPNVIDTAVTQRQAPSNRREQIHEDGVCIFLSCDNYPLGAAEPWGASKTPQHTSKEAVHDLETAVRA